jgi:hypothetical protein
MRIARGEKSSRLPIGVATTNSVPTMCVLVDRARPHAGSRWTDTILLYGHSDDRGVNRHGCSLEA